MNSLNRYLEIFWLLFCIPFVLTTGYVISAISSVILAEELAVAGEDVFLKIEKWSEGLFFLAVLVLLKIEDSRWEGTYKNLLFLASLLLYAIFFFLATRYGVDIINVFKLYYGEIFYYPVLLFFIFALGALAAKLYHTYSSFREWLESIRYNFFKLLTVIFFFIINPKKIFINIIFLGAFILIPQILYEFIVIDFLNLSELAKKNNQFNLKNIENNPNVIDINYLSSYYEILRNRGWLFWMVFSLLGAVVGLGLAWWGRQIQHESHLQEVYEKSVNMLNSESLAARVAGCKDLEDLGKRSEAMRAKCLTSLSAFINHAAERFYTGKGKNKLVEWPIRERLPVDIHEAANSFCNIYKSHRYFNLDVSHIHLPLFFWRNIRRTPVCIRCSRFFQANLSEANLMLSNFELVSIISSNFNGADFWNSDLNGIDIFKSEFNEVHFEDARLKKIRFFETNLTGASFKQGEIIRGKFANVNLKNANLEGAKVHKTEFYNVNFSGANLTRANLGKAKNLSVEQIVSAKWYSYNGKGAPPILPLILRLDSRIQEWLKTPAVEAKTETKSITKAKTKVKAKVKTKTKKKAKANKPKRA